MSSNRILVSYPSLRTQKKHNKLFSDLGKATKRGIKKCYKCGTNNGTRGYACKNKQCDAIFKEFTEKRKVNLAAVKLTGTSKHIYSVRVKDKGPDYRGFVQLPSSTSTNAHARNAICFVDSCQRLFDDSILKCHEIESKNISSACIHIESALQSISVADPLELKENVLNSMKASVEIKQKLWASTIHSKNAIVQRVSKYIMAVDCQVSAKHPLGYLHFRFGMGKGKDPSDKYTCSCSNYKGTNGLPNKCIHYYACICSLASNPKLVQEFPDFIQLEFKIDTERIGNPQSINNPENDFHKIVPYKHNLIPKTDVLHANAKFGRKMKENQLKSLELEEKTTLNFKNWLNSVTECINSTLNSNDSDNTKLIFYIPPLFEEKIYNCELKLQSIEKYVRKLILANGIFYQYSWHIMNILHVQTIFNTTEVSLRIAQQISHDKQEESSLNQNKALITPFIIEWTPNILKVSEFGELKFLVKTAQKYI